MDRTLALHTYFTKELKPGLFALTDQNLPDSYFEPSWMSSSYAAKRIDEYFQTFNSTGYYIKDAVIDARNSENEADSYERAFIGELKDDPTLVTRSNVQKIHDTLYFVFMRRGETLDESCLRCHGDPSSAPEDLLQAYGTERGYHRAPEIGATISAISIRIPVTKAFAMADSLTAAMAVVLFCVLALLLLIQWLLSNWLFFKPLAVIRMKALLISTDESHLGETIGIPQASELGDMAMAFNAMSKALRSDRDTLDDHINERTAELIATKGQLEQELAERRNTEAALRETLLTNDRLLKELQHRVKNSFSMITSMIELSSKPDLKEETLDLLVDLNSRVRSVSELYSILYASGDFGTIRLDDYCMRVAAPIVALAGNLTLVTELDAVHVVAKDAATLGLIVNELVTNAVKHAFSHLPEGTITITLHGSGGMAVLGIHDDGVGLPMDAESARRSHGMGLGLVSNLAEQLSGSLTIGTAPRGASFTIEFPIDQGSGS